MASSCSLCSGKVLRNASSTLTAAVQSSSRISAAPASYSAVARIAGRRRCRANPQEVVGGRAIVLRLVCELTLLVDRGGEVVDERGARLVAFRRDRQHLGVGVLGLRVLGELERAVRNDNPRGTPDGRVRARIGIDDALGGHRWRRGSPSSRTCHRRPLRGSPRRVRAAGMRRQI